MESKYSPLILALVFLILFFVFIIKNENANNPSQKTNKVSVSQTFHLASHKGWSNDLQTIVWNQEKNYYDIYFLHSVDGATDPGHIQRLKILSPIVNKRLLYQQRVVTLKRDGILLGQVV